MPQKKIKIINKLGLHARASMKLVNLASRFQSEITISYQQRDINAKSIMSLMATGASCGHEILIKTSGDDQDAAIKAIEALFNDRFGEGE